jgi:hypothetical protein
MTTGAGRPAQPSDVAMWHRLSGLPDNVSDDGEIVVADAGRRQQAEKQALRAALADLSAPVTPERARHLARLAASYLLAGDVETARRYVAQAQALRAALDGCG